MRITVTIEGELYEKAIKMADHNMKKSELFRQVLITYIRVQEAKRLAAVGETSTNRI